MQLRTFLILLRFVTIGKNNGGCYLVNQETRREVNSKEASMAEKENSYVHPAIPKFDGHYDRWEMLMENLLRSKEYWEIVEQGIPILMANATLDQQKMANEVKLKDLKAKNYLFQALACASY